MLLKAKRLRLLPEAGGFGAVRGMLAVDFAAVADAQYKLNAFRIPLDALGLDRVGNLFWPDECFSDSGRYGQKSESVKWSFV